MTFPYNQAQEIVNFVHFFRLYNNYISFALSFILILFLVMLTSAERFNEKVCFPDSFRQVLKLNYCLLSEVTMFVVVVVRGLVHKESSLCYLVTGLSV